MFGELLIILIINIKFPSHYNKLCHHHVLFPLQDIELDEDSAGDENVDPEQENGKDTVEESKDVKREKDINEEYDMDNYDDGKFSVLLLSLIHI